MEMWVTATKDKFRDLEGMERAEKCVAVPDSHKPAAAVALIISKHEALLEDWGLKKMGEFAKRSLLDAKGSLEKLTPFLNGGKRKRVEKFGKNKKDLALHAVLTSPDAYSHEEAPKCVAKYLKAAGKLKQTVCIPDSHKRAAAVALIISKRDNLFEDWGLKETLVYKTMRSLRDAKGSWEKLSSFLHAGGRGGPYHPALHALLTSPDAYSHKEAPKCVAKYLKAAGKLEQTVCIPDSHKRAAAVAMIISPCDVRDSLRKNWGLNREMVKKTMRSLRDAKGSWEKLSPFLNNCGRGGQGQRACADQDVCPAKGE